MSVSKSLPSFRRWPSEKKQKTKNKTQQTAMKIFKVSLLLMYSHLRETDYLSEMGYPLDDSRQTDNTSSFEKGTVSILDGQSA